MKTGRIVPKLPLLYKTVNLYKIFDICKALNIYKTFNIYKAVNIYKAINIRKILLPLNGYSGMYGVSKTSEDKASRPVLDVEKVIALLSINAKG